MAEIVENKEVQTSPSLPKRGINTWMIVSAVLVISLIVVVFWHKSNITGNAIASDSAAPKLIDFVNKYLVSNGSVTFSSIRDIGDLYEVNVTYNGGIIPTYLTKDGKYYVKGIMDMANPPSKAAATPSTNTNTQAAPAPNVTKSAKPVVEAFVMSYCPYGTQIEKGIIPVAKLLGNKIDFTIKFVSYSMHGQKEIDENTVQYCIQKEQNDKYLTYLECFLQAGNNSDCLASAKIDKTKLDACIKAADTEFSITKNFNDTSSYLSGKFPKYDVYADLNTKYGVQGSPTLVINGVKVSSGRDSASLLKAVCAAFTTAPSECSQTLSSTSPSPGFGATAASSGTSSGGGCGSA